MTSRYGPDAFARIADAVSADGTRLWVLQTASVDYSGPDGGTVTLMTVHHYSTCEYFQELLAALRDADAIWIEGFVPWNGQPLSVADLPRPLGALMEYARYASKAAALDSQVEWVARVGDTRWKTADLDLVGVRSLFEAGVLGDWTELTDAWENELSRLRGFVEQGGAIARRHARLSMMFGVPRSEDATGEWTMPMYRLSMERERVAWEAIGRNLSRAKKQVILWGVNHAGAFATRLVDAGYEARSIEWHDAFAVEVEPPGSGS